MAVEKTEQDSGKGAEHAPRFNHFSLSVRLRAGIPFLYSFLAYSAIVVLLLRPTLGAAMWTGHDELHPVVRTMSMCRLWRIAGPFHTPWSPEMVFGHGYPFFTFYAPLGYYVAASFHFIFKLGYAHATKWSFYSSLYLSGLIMYGLVYTIGRRKKWPRLHWWAFAAACIYSLARYHLTDTFARDNLSECWGWTMLPALFWSAEVARERRLLGTLLVAIAYDFFMLSHNITALYGTICIGVYVVLTSRDKRWLFSVIGGGILGAAMSAYFWYPALSLVKLVRASDPWVMVAMPGQVREHAIYWQQHLVETLGNEGSIPGPHDKLGINIGLVVLTGALLALGALFRRDLNKPQRFDIAVSLGFVAVLLFIMSPQMPWEWTPVLFRNILFPWRLLIFTSFFGCLALVSASPVVDRWVHPAVLVGWAMLLSIPTVDDVLRHPLVYRLSTKQLEQWYAAQEQHKLFGGTGGQEYLPLTTSTTYTDPDFQAKNPPPNNRLTVLQGEIDVEKYQHVGTHYAYTYSAPEVAKARISVLYFPGWQLQIDNGRSTEVTQKDSDGLVVIQLPGGRHTFDLFYTLSPVGRVARVTSYFAWILWLGGTLFIAHCWWKDRHRGPRDSSAGKLSKSLAIQYNARRLE